MERGGRARKENVNQTLGLGKHGKAPSRVPGWNRGIGGWRRVVARRNYGGTGGMKSIDARRERVCVLPFIRALDRVRASVRRCKCNSRRGLVVSSPGDISPLLRTKLSLSLSFPLSLLHSRLCSGAGKLDVFSSPGGRRCRVSAPESSVCSFFHFSFFFSTFSSLFLPFYTVPPSGRESRL